MSDTIKDVLLCVAIFLIVFSLFFAPIMILSMSEIDQNNYEELQEKLVKLEKHQEASKFKAKLKEFLNDSIISNYEYNELMSIYNSEMGRVGANKLKQTLEK